MPVWWQRFAFGGTSMRKASVTLLLCMLLIFVSCGTTTPSALNGLWSANLKTSAGTDTFDFSATLAQGSGTSVTVSNFDLSIPSGSLNTCLSGQTSETATFSSMGNETGQFAMSISGALGGVLTIKGNLTNNSNGQSIAGQWTLTGASGCNASGTFLMSPHPPV